MRWGWILKAIAEGRGEIGEVKIAGRIDASFHTHISAGKGSFDSALRMTKRVRAYPGPSSVMTENRLRLAIPNEVVMATSEASRPVAMSTRPMRGWLWRASKVHQRSPR